MKQEINEITFRQSIKALISDANRNPRTIDPELKAFADMLYQFRIPDDCRPEQRQTLITEDGNIPRCFFLFFISADGKEKTSICINLNNKNIYSILEAISERTDFNVFLSVGTFHVNPSNAAKGKSPFRRTQTQASRINSLFADLDYYHLKGSRFEGMSPEEVLQVIRMEHPEYFDGSLPMTFVKSGNGIQVYLSCDSFPVAIPRWYHFWKACNIRFNEILSEYGSDPKCAPDVCRILRLPNSYNVKKDPIQVDFLTDIADKKLSNEKLLDFLGLAPEDTVAPKSKKAIAMERAKAKREKELQERILKREQEAQRRREREEFAEWIKNSTEEDISLREKEREKYSSLGKSGFKKLTKKRLSDFETILARDDYQMEGKRNYFLFLYGITYHAFYRDEDELFLKLLSINEKLQDPLDDGEVEGIANHVMNGSYSRLTNQYIIDVLELTEEDTSDLLISYTEKQRLERDRLRSRKRRYERYENGISPVKRRIERNAQIVLDNMDKPNKVLMELTGLKHAALGNLKKKVRDGILPTKK
ncbi:MAG: hypothetical protein K0R00_2623 [Herbinix sp.]|jgi:hypothetical protein|nr:hypothetical protein [Herbinix sp.]